MTAVGRKRTLEQHRYRPEVPRFALVGEPENTKLGVLVAAREAETGETEAQKRERGGFHNSVVFT